MNKIRIVWRTGNVHGNEGEVLIKKQKKKKKKKRNSLSRGDD